MADGSVSVDVLAIEMKKQGKALQTHVRGCGKLQIQNAKTLKELSEGQALLAQRFEIIDTIGRYAGLISRYGKRVTGIIGVSAIGALTTILVQNVMLHNETIKTAQVAASAATRVENQQVTLGQKIDSIKTHAATQ